MSDEFLAMAFSVLLFAALGAAFGDSLADSLPDPTPITVSEVDQ